MFTPMTSPREQWPELFWFFDVMHQDWDLEGLDKDAYLDEVTADSTLDDLHKALVQWQEAFGSASDDAVASIVSDFNPWWDPEHLFGGARQWAEWVKLHLEGELARRA